METVAGTGKQSRGFLDIGGPGASTALDSPWGLVIQGGYLYIAMAGSHQVWRMDLAYSPRDAMGRQRGRGPLGRPAGRARDGPTVRHNH